MNDHYGDLTLTTEQIQARLNLVPEHSQSIAVLQQAITAFVTSEQVQTLLYLGGGESQISILIIHDFLFFSY